MFLHLFALCHRGIIEHLCCQTRYWQSGVFSSWVILLMKSFSDLRISLLPEDDHNGKDEGNQQYQREDDTQES